MLLTGGFEAHFALPVEPCVSVLGVYLQDRLEFSAATIDAALHEGHGDSPLFRCRFVFLNSAVGAVPRGRRLDWLWASLATLGAAVAFALHGGFRAHLFAGPENVPRHHPSLIVSARRRICARISSA